MSPVEPFLVHIRCDTDGYTHAVTEDEFAAGRHDGRFRAVCGHVVLAAPMIEAPGRFDPVCRVVLRDAPEPSVPRQERRRSRWRTRR
ncbi:hypothetical protein SAMN05421837_103222 [Amycolatopsis pretoriensis]|uniref:Uncharacterized protein n=1 Tax=Amycolatopsis pretoriensis TaxID=218821 RepID=A0A1H5QLX8_9PSEU|nr:hypothetical protein [Amycolatopsis pretoriensis]SEF26351.1 hypothetical protein SAMN05421837_103222 [Amycolatopsis pretoriensis]